MSVNNINSKVKHWIPFFTFIIAFFCIPLIGIDFFSKMPGDLGDARLNNYFLEYFFLYLAGEYKSIWHFEFFYPFPYIVGFSDNLYGSAIFYAIPRAILGETDTAFQVWFLVGYLLNFCSAYYALRLLDLGRPASAVGALIFAFSLPTTAHAAHAQLHYRFGIPLAVSFFILFLNKNNVRFFGYAVFWLTWQFFCGIYMGFFASLLLLIIFIIYIFLTIIQNRFSNSEANYVNYFNIFKMKLGERVFVFSVIVFCMFALILLFWPYVVVQSMYGTTRNWTEIATMLPRLQSYFISFSSLFWNYPSSLISHAIPMRHEHQMFSGIAVFVLGISGLIIGWNQRDRQTYLLMTGAFMGAVVITFYIDGFSLWYLFHWLPLASAIRAMTRIDQALLFPAGYLAALAVDKLDQKSLIRTCIFGLIVLILIIEFSAVSLPTSNKNEWRERIEKATRSYPKVFRDGAIFFAAQQDSWFESELDAMWVSLKLGVPTMNGYSGNVPPRYNVYFGKKCAELPYRIMSYLDFIGEHDKQRKYLDIVSRVYEINFTDCDPNWRINMPSVSFTNEVYTPAEFKNLKIEILDTEILGNSMKIELKFINKLDKVFSARSNTPIRLSWRFLDSDRNPLTGFDSRVDLPFDIPKNGNLKISFDVLELPKNSNFIEISFVQEAVFWAHDIGIETAVLYLKQSE